MLKVSARPQHGGRPSAFRCSCTVSQPAREAAAPQVFARKNGVDASKDSRAVQKLRREAERAKRALSTQKEVRSTCERTTQSTEAFGRRTRPRLARLPRAGPRITRPERALCPARHTGAPRD
eukprot:435711-Prymnesium_polylepis.1